MSLSLLMDEHYYYYCGVQQVSINRWTAREAPIHIFYSARRELCIHKHVQNGNGPRGKAYIMQINADGPNGNFVFIGSNNRLQRNARRILLYTKVCFRFIFSFPSPFQLMCRIIRSVLLAKH